MDITLRRRQLPLEPWIPSFEPRRSSEQHPPMEGKREAFSAIGLHFRLYTVLGVDSTLFLLEATRKRI